MAGGFASTREAFALHSAHSVSTLLEARADVNERRQHDGNTPLHFAAFAASDARVVEVRPPRTECDRVRVRSTRCPATATRSFPALHRRF
jgi:hypothetical protein